jgi:PPOX class probable F420-dependent enzyme
VPTIATATTVDRAGIEAFVAPRHRGILMTTRADGRPQLSPVTMGMADGAILVATYPDRAKARNIRRTGTASVLVLSDEFNGAWVQIDGVAVVVDLPDAEDGLVEYFRVISGEHSDWDEYRAAMRAQGKCLVRVAIDAWGPVATGGFPPEVAARMDAGG